MNKVENLLKPSCNRSKPSEENSKNIDFITNMELKLQQKEKQLSQKEQKLKEIEVRLKNKEELLIKKELDLNQKMLKYSTLLEKIISQNQNKGEIKPIIENQHHQEKSYRNNNLSEYQHRVISLLNTIRSNSQQQQQQIHQQSLLGNTLEITDDKFNKSTRAMQWY